VPACSANKIKGKATAETYSTGSLGDDDDIGVWSRFKGFEPNPSARFNSEFWRLSKHQGWTREERRERRVELFDADFAAHFGNDTGDISTWRELCRLCSIDPIPASIPECIEVSNWNALFAHFDTDFVGSGGCPRQHLRLVGSPALRSSDQALRELHGVR